MERHLKLAKALKDSHGQGDALQVCSSASSTLPSTLAPVACTPDGCALYVAPCVVCTYVCNMAGCHVHVPGDCASVPLSFWLWC